MKIYRINDTKWTMNNFNNDPRHLKSKTIFVYSARYTSNHLLVKTTNLKFVKDNIYHANFFFLQVFW